MASSRLAPPRSVSLFELASGPTGAFVSRPDGFPVELYRSMKYGDRVATMALADRLAPELVAAFPALTACAAPPRFLVAYKAVPPACYFLSRYCLAHVNCIRIAGGRAPGDVLRVHKDQVTATNYAAADRAQRRRELDGIHFELIDDVTSQPVCVVDDVRVTGSAEEKILEVIERGSPSLIALGYVAVVSAELAGDDPAVEDRLNGSSPHRLDALIAAVEADQFDLNIRTLKWLLALPAVDLGTLLDASPDALLAEIANGTRDTGTAFIARHEPGYRAVRRELARRCGA